MRQGLINCNPGKDHGPFPVNKNKERLLYISAIRIFSTTCMLFQKDFDQLLLHAWNRALLSMMESL